MSLENGRCSLPACKRNKVVQCGTGLVLYVEKVLSAFFLRTWRIDKDNPIQRSESLKKLL
ncbi:hypothetical protein M514_26459 [Trichuris suis]|uniref:Uncharacterized protein n=1 Tax=Trichuris suis TaxID=68888 RepID=A0A085MVT0_9BILA|nr:hypothetical protein M514_26459 [Trichuris suis]